ncbi:hypothetical protein [Halospeciosus flavus]|uniref:Uncharacterized protein n=2 Tax=Halospeciosus flavus TaxID=3032283 RepID=A0ABD5Z503_9EURY|nr:hypothetical protein [Halospeciosus flavus]
MNTKAALGIVLLVVFGALLLWTTMGDTVNTLSLGLAAVAAVGLSIGTLLVGVSEEGRTV